MLVEEAGAAGIQAITPSRKLQCGFSKLQYCHHWSPAGQRRGP
jgi:hypothetical protein